MSATRERETHRFAGLPLHRLLAVASSQVEQADDGLRTTARFRRKRKRWPGVRFGDGAEAESSRHRRLGSTRKHACCSPDDCAPGRGKPGTGDPGSTPVQVLAGPANGLRSGAVARKL